MNSLGGKLFCCFFFHKKFDKFATRKDKTRTKKKHGKTNKMEKNLEPEEKKQPHNHHTHKMHTIQTSNMNEELVNQYCLGKEAQKNSIKKKADETNKNIHCFSILTQHAGEPFRFRCLVCWFLQGFLIHSLFARFE
eukprot:c11740_g2_i1.p2 GENE.c11740_g2_i1~~c11740_g2_i1.p2  ORF type:complete len:136 (+),score=20.93 c11740_g2_i1:140-547(+)